MTDKKVWFITGAGRGMASTSLGPPSAPATPWWPRPATHPDDVLIQDGPQPFRVSVREIDGDARTEGWDRAVTVFPPYAEYQKRTNRVIPSSSSHAHRPSPPIEQRTLGAGLPEPAMALVEALFAIR
jgi:F420H(2)-dependent quinone reductase